MTYGVLDTRDLIEERDDLLANAEPSATGEFGEIVRQGLAAAFSWLPDHIVNDYTPLDDIDQEWVDAINALLQEIDAYSGDTAEDGVTLIRESEFTSYAEDLADDFGLIDNSAAWPNNYIDWDAAAEALRQDYTSVLFDGIWYLYR